MKEWMRALTHSYMKAGGKGCGSALARIFLTESRRADMKSRYVARSRAEEALSASVAAKKRARVHAMPWLTHETGLSPGSKTGSQGVTCAVVLYARCYYKVACHPIGRIIHSTESG